MGIVDDIMGGNSQARRDSENQKYLASLQPRVDRINALEATIEELGDDELVAKTEEFQARIRNGEDKNGDLLEEAFAVVREAAWCVH